MYRPQAAKEKYATDSALFSFPSSTRLWSYAFGISFIEKVPPWLKGRNVLIARYHPSSAWTALVCFTSVSRDKPPLQDDQKQAADPFPSSRALFAAVDCFTFPSKLVKSIQKRIAFFKEKGPHGPLDYFGNIVSELLIVLIHLETDFKTRNRSKFFFLETQEVSLWSVDLITLGEDKCVGDMQAL